MRKNVVVKGAYGEANFGDDALMCTIENFFLTNDLRLNVDFCGSSSDYCKRLLRKSGYVDLNDNKKTTADVLIYGGGTQFFLFNSNKGGFYLKLFWKLLTANPGMLIKKIKSKFFGKTLVSAKKSVGLGLGLGPFNPENNKIEDVKNLVGQMDMLYVRDATSLSYCKDWGYEDVNEGADICYSSFLNYDKSIRSNGTGNHNGQKRKKIGVIVRDWNYENGGNAYQDTLLRMIDTNNDPQYEFTFIIFSSLRDVEWKKIISARRYPCLEWDPFQHGIEHFMDKLNAFDGFITARYHGGVMASVLNKPVVCIGIEPKLGILSRQVKGFRLWDMPFRADDLKQAMKVFDDNNFDCTASVNSLRKKADAMFDSLHQYLCELENRQ
ncbi:polysaccharide pyruvyl transferase family protein [Chitinophaga filiformis]|uniref:polysaccharide pyruvyl transferase family protein n=1 Tax=Chitinophaga filiformis TaxID=104663 RepID=UPI001F3FEBBD|nr:polysaccharide pyruvyl transferase family protein [Chitinophaga filiformis]MCF6405367.1 polysaccharide pyruvyl transferase family protein [Chitinophaga filiformis]